jgi:DNA-binding MarR family transcriptional regulator
MAQTVAELCEDGLVTRRPDPGDRRQTLIELTELGRRTLERERAKREGWLAGAIAEQLTPDEQQVLARAVPLLGRLADL